jgi:hypothetical protein
MMTCAAGFEEVETRDAAGLTTIIHPVGDFVLSMRLGDHGGQRPRAARFVSPRGFRAQLAGR